MGPDLLVSSPKQSKNLMPLEPTTFSIPSCPLSDAAPGTPRTCTWP